jgi:hypothetical protein
MAWSSAMMTLMVFQGDASLALAGAAVDSSVGLMALGGVLFMA